jgi:hypothetical protein
MDYLDPAMRRKQLILLFTGYALITIAIGLAALVLLLVVYGFGIGKDGKVVQNGLLFVSSTPAGANINLNGAYSNHQTNMRANLVEGSYTLQLQRTGYRDWQRQITIQGGKIVRYDYPFLFPTTLSTKVRKAYSGTVGLSTASPDGRWLLVEPTAGLANFDIFDMNDQKAAPTLLTIPPADYTAGGSQSWQLVAWSADKVHVVLQHGYGTTGATEFIEVDRTDATKTVNLSKLFGETPDKLSLINGKYNQYYLYEAKTQELSKATQTEPDPQLLLSKVLAFAAYGNDTVLYVTPRGDGQAVDERLLVGTKDYDIRQMPVSTSYPVALNSFQGDLYVVAAASSSNAVYIYKDPVGQSGDAGVTLPIPLTVLRLINPSYVSFSFGGRIIVAENGTNFAAYDNQYQELYRYVTTPPIDASQPNATWMDGAHLQYVSNGKLYIFDFDGSNGQSLVPARNNLTVFYTADYKYLYTIAAQKSGLHDSLLVTPLRTAADL